MNKLKISPDLLNNISILSSKPSSVIITSNNFLQTKYFLKCNNYKFTPYRFANCFFVKADYEDLKIFSNLKCVSYIYPNICVQTLSDEKNFVNLEKLTNNTFCGQGETICFIDTGIFPHLDFILPYNKIIKFVDFINNTNHPYDDNGHGTFVCGTACGNGILNRANKGFAPGANIVCLKALNKIGTSTSNTILEAMEWIFQNHKVYNISTVCMSFGADYVSKFDPLSMGAQALWKIGLTVVAAAGNSGPNKNTIKSPGISPNIITVGAFDCSTNSVAEFSSRGPTPYGNKPDLIAPAINIISCNNSILPYTTMSGTSVAAPIIAGICADIKSKNKNFSNNQIKNFLTKNCKKLTGDINSEGYGYITF